MTTASAAYANAADRSRRNFPMSTTFSYTPILCNDDIILEFRSKFEGFAEQISREVCHTRDKAVTAALIALGWTPPPVARTQSTTLMKLPLFTESGYERNKQRELAVEMNIVLDFLSRCNVGAPESVQRAAEIVCSHVAMQEEIREEES